jgi:hypothetical protein
MSDFTKWLTPTVDVLNAFSATLGQAGKAGFNVYLHIQMVTGLPTIRTQICSHVI